MGRRAVTGWITHAVVRTTQSPDRKSGPYLAASGRGVGQRFAVS